ALVPANASYGAAEVLSLASASVNDGAGGTVPLVTSEAVHKAIDLGDATGDGNVGGLDASDIARLGKGVAAGLPVSKLIDAVLMGDLTGDGALSTLDASDAAQMFVNPASQPQVPLPLGTGSVVALGDPTVQTGLGAATTIFAVPGGTAKATVQ